MLAHPQLTVAYAESQDEVSPLTACVLSGMSADCASITNPCAKARRKLLTHPFLACDQKDCPLRDLANTRNTGMDEVLRCSVCKQLFGGQEIRLNCRSLSRARQCLSSNRLYAVLRWSRVFPVWITTQPQFVLWIRVLVFVHNK